MKAANHRIRNTGARLLAGILVLGTASGALAGCGGSSSPAQTASTVHMTTSAALPSPHRAQQPPAHASARPTSAKLHILYGQAERSRTAAVLPPKDKRTTSAPKAINPCTLVSKAEATKIAGEAIVRTAEAPLGPTCIYTGHGGKTAITLAVESMNLAQVTHQMTRLSRLTLPTHTPAAHTAYCGTLGGQMLFAPLANGQVLNVTAPCSIAPRIAATALSRLNA